MGANSNQLQQGVNFGSFIGNNTNMRADQMPLTGVIQFPLSREGTKRKFYFLASATDQTPVMGIARFQLNGQDVLRLPVVIGTLDNGAFGEFIGNLVPSFSVKGLTTNHGTLHTSGWADTDLGTDCITVWSTQNLQNDANGNAVNSAIVAPFYVNVEADNFSLDIVRSTLTAIGADVIQIFAAVYSSPYTSQ